MPWSSTCRYISIFRWMRGVYWSCTKLFLWTCFRKLFVGIFEIYCNRLSLPHEEKRYLFVHNIFFEFLEIIYLNCVLQLFILIIILTGLSASESLALMRQEREVKPNVGFLCQIGRLDDELRKERFRSQAISKSMPESPKFFRFQYKKPIQ